MTNNRSTSPTLLGEDKEILHFSHPHTLTQIHHPYLFTCMGCKEFGAGNMFKCLECDFDLHDFCALAPPSLKTHSLHSQHPLVFHTKSVCAKNIVNGLYANGIKAPDKPSKFGRAVGVASHVLVGFIGGLLEGIGEGVGQALFDSVVTKEVPPTEDE
ncbi:uncharacterized protein LOC122083099 isoform X2 [Macadamia integrifolia]|uniref:uncharacterized protein LOC122083099 isoform X2 n=1 Tax=Macadamia integrifolia TaxID=60698 RepID=UPI001C4EED48|nr:uncharacterized protein LOC122083099 isoform X2 [Macadamia integrifolia]